MPTLLLSLKESPCLLELSVIFSAFKALPTVPTRTMQDSWRLLLLSPKSWGSGLLPQFCNPLTGWDGVVQAACNSVKFWAPWRLCN